MPGTTKKKWIQDVKTDSTYPPEGLFTRDPETIARTPASKKVSPKGPGSGMRMLTYFMNRAGKGLSETRRHSLEKAKRLLSERIHEVKEHYRPRQGRA
jgi:tRNA(adenine34) deaminase